MIRKSEDLPETLLVSPSRKGDVDGTIFLAKSAVCHRLILAVFNHEQEWAYDPSVPYPVACFVC